VEAFLEIFPKADIYTGLVGKSFPEGLIKKRVRKCLSSPFLFMGRNAFSKLLVQVYWESLNLSEYDLVISSSDDFSSKAVITKPNTLHICYCHTPPRYLYTEYSSYKATKSRLPLVREFLLFILRQRDFLSSTRPDIFVTCSVAVQKRIEKYYRRESVVVYPPVFVPDEEPINKKAGKYYLYIGSLDKRKGIDFMIKAFNYLGKPLVIAGDGVERDRLLKEAGRNIRFVGIIRGMRKHNYLRRACGFVFTSIDEEFGIAPVEAMAFGIPVIAHKSGGVKETVVEGKTGTFFEKFTMEAFIEAFRKFEKTKFDPYVIYRQSLKFSSKRFKEKMIELLMSEYEKNKKKHRF